MATSGIHLTHYKDCKRCCWKIVIKNAPEEWIRKIPARYGLNRDMEIDKEVVKNAIEDYEVEFDIIGSCTHGMIQKKKIKKKRPLRPIPQVSIDDPEKLEEYLSTPGGKRHAEFAKNESDKIDWSELFM